MSAGLIEDLRRNAGYAGNPKGLLLKAADALASRDEEIKRLTAGLEAIVARADSNDPDREEEWWQGYTAGWGDAGMQALQILQGGADA